MGISFRLKSEITVRGNVLLLGSLLEIRMSLRAINRSTPKLSSRQTQTRVTLALQSSRARHRPPETPQLSSAREGCLAAIAVNLAPSHMLGIQIGAHSSRYQQNYNARLLCAWGLQASCPSFPRSNFGPTSCIAPWLRAHRCLRRTPHLAAPAHGLRHPVRRPPRPLPRYQDRRR